MLLKSPQKFCMRQRHYFLLVSISIIFVFKTDVAVIYMQNPVGGDLPAGRQVATLPRRIIWL